MDIKNVLLNVSRYNLKVLIVNKKDEIDHIDSYFECISECCIINGHKECVTRCIEIHLKGGNSE